MDGKTTLELVTCARLPAEGLAALAGLRRAEGISVILDRDHAWVFWKPGDDPILRALLPVPGVLLYESRGEDWYRPGHSLPSFEVPTIVDPVSLDRAITPEPFKAETSRSDATSPTGLRLVRDGLPRPTTASLCSLDELGRWADSAPSASIESIRGAIRGRSALLVGRKLPPWPGSTRYWGRRVLTPIGFEIRPGLPEETLAEALGAGAGDLLRVVPRDEGLTVEVVPLGVFRPLSRAGVRLAFGTSSP